MTAAEQRSRLACDGGAMDRFPVGMRVLAVDDNPICLKVLEELLHKCQYHVSTTNQAIKALQMLREDRNKFDLVISDVNMPDMDGFELLEHVGLEMDLPVIMLSGHSDTKLVLKGISHGACDYLLKPVRIEELKNIWQHVIRRKKFDTKDQDKWSNQEKACHGRAEGGEGVSPPSTLDENGKFSRKRKEYNEDEEEEVEDHEHENDDPSTQKKPRVVWSGELHRKFVAVVHQLGFEKAVPKKILDLMNVEGLTRENVASHLQKYRLYLKRLFTNPQTSMVAGLRGRDSSYSRMGALDGFGDYSLSGSQRLSNVALSPCSPSGTVSRLNSPSGLTLRGITSSNMVQPGHSQNLRNSTNTLVKLQPYVPANPSLSSYQGVPTPLKVNQLQHSIGASNPNNDPTSYTIPSSFPNTRVCASSIHFDPNALANPMTQQTYSMGVFGNQSSLRVSSSNPESYEIGTSSDVLVDNRCSESWQVDVQLSKFQSSSLPMSESFNHGQLLAGTLGISSTRFHIGNIPNDFSSVSVYSAPIEELRGNIHNEEGLTGDAFPTMVSANVIEGSVRPSLDQNGAAGCNTMNSSSFEHGISPTVMRSSEVEKSAMQATMKLSEDYPLEQTKFPDGFIQDSYESLNDIMSAIMKQEEQIENMPMPIDGEFGFDAYSLGSCI